MNAVECRITSIILPRVIPSRIFISWRCGRVLGKTAPFPANDQMISVKESFIVPKQIGEDVSVILAVHAIDKKGNSIKFSDAKIDIPESIYTKKSVFLQGICTSSIGEFVVETELVAKNNNFPTPPYEAEEYASSYIEIVNSIESTIDDDTVPERYIKADELLNTFSELPADSVSDAQIQRITDSFDKLEKCNTKLNGRYDLIVQTILGMMEKDYLFVLPNGQVKSYGSFHNSQELRYPYIGLILCNTLKKLSSPSIGFNLEEIDHFMIEICSLFAGLIANDEQHDRGLLYIVTNICFLVQYIRTNLQLNLPNFELMILITYKQIIARILEIDVQQINKFINNPKKFITWYKDHTSMCNDLGVPKNILNMNIHSYLIKHMDFSIMKWWLSQPTVGTADYQALVSSVPGQWPYLTSLMFIVSNAEKLVKKKVTKDQIYAPCRGSIFISILRKLESLKMVSISQRQYAAITEPDKVKAILQSANDYSEAINSIATDVIIADNLPEPQSI
ncbi:hypothetical protein TVAG_205630 [Trichomonas vaginalis G3]|uniref:Uncharacterized protein n=1 Tax=Trichomonas vaginalis (strain ATCC PRA-98 / G3) TaxID=412133 RepID=A2FJF2_TRIV3|nr:hypothetical protein TVAGG3_0873340 [Trichomonas vaginalis G3]EAX94965.1 hypothetical protein TVAG_205630 [Trichomonas vaginalis G3]KAI5501517.1 hypothetical protein TVAGG3_0873340 [Trichomonas vaginalis G3]|eukprot:XP_001307895.1 hypothetical protein [Trichomonas vaginalis G3]